MARSAPARASASVISRPTRTAAPVTSATRPARGDSGTLHRNLSAKKTVFRMKHFRLEEAMKKILVFRLAALAAGLSLAAPARAGSVSGRVLDASGHPVVGAKVLWLAYRDEDQLLLDRTTGKDPAPVGQAATDSSGRFRVALEKPGQSAAIRIVPAGLPSARYAGPFDASEDTDLADVQIPPAAQLSGRVLDEGGKPVAGARVFVIGSEALLENDVRLLAETRTAADGSFAAPDAPEGTRVLYVQAPGFVPLTHIQMDPRSEERVVLRGGGTIRGTVVD